MADEQDLQRLRSGETDLSFCDFRDADLSGMNLSGRNFSQSHLERVNATGANLVDAIFDNAMIAQMNFSQARCHGASFRTVAYAVNFSDADLRSAKFSTIITQTNFNGADISEAIFRGSNIQDGTSFDGTKFDSKTDFEGVTCLRSIARNPVFGHFRFEKGKLFRLDLPLMLEEAPQPESTLDETSATPNVEDVTLETGNASSNSSSLMEERLSQNSQQVRSLAGALSLKIDNELEELRNSKPNDPAALDTYASYVGLLEEISRKLSLISAALEDMKSGDIGSSDNKAIATSLIDDLQTTLNDWLSKNGANSISYGLNVGMLGLGAGFLSFCGVSANLSFPALLFLLGGKALVDTVKGASKKSTAT